MISVVSKYWALLESPSTLKPGVGIMKILVIANALLSTHIGKQKLEAI
jgi:hypothetical protein